MATDYDGLKTEIEGWLDNPNPNLIAAIPVFIEFAEAFFRRHLHVREMECRATHPIVPTGTSDADRGVYDLPADWGGHRSVELDADLVTLLYWKKLPALTTQNQTNWLLTKHPDLYLFASLGHAEGWLKNDPRIPLWDQAAKTAMAEVENHDKHDRYSGGPIKTRVLTERFWRGESQTAGRYEYLPPFDFFDLDISGLRSTRGCPGYFTVAENKLRVWPRPNSDPAGTVGWVGCDETPAPTCCDPMIVVGQTRNCFIYEPSLYIPAPYNLTIEALNPAGFSVNGGAVNVVSAQTASLSSFPFYPDGDYVIIELQSMTNLTNYTVEYTGTDLKKADGTPVCASWFDLRVESCG